MNSILGTQWVGVSVASMINTSLDSGDRANLEKDLDIISIYTMTGTTGVIRYIYLYTSLYFYISTLIDCLL